MVFLPLIYLKGLARAFFGVQAFAIVTSLAASLLFSLTVTPVLSGNDPAGIPKITEETRGGAAICACSTGRSAGPGRWYWRGL